MKNLMIGLVAASVKTGCVCVVTPFETLQMGI